MSKKDLDLLSYEMIIRSNLHALILFYRYTHNLKILSIVFLLIFFQEFMRVFSWIFKHCDSIDDKTAFS